ncbi:MAG: hypothetical protein A3G34_00680 [Candidatus Lindowbacteria bacterium RIFCSPLOWO2_12_FULL_62_27]|nr:MAG: hypothetical protein A3G34_00680 [Candidatus Lindowbacteria bacterium RIFCSPLOWO2_12_FULL_62_27]OGH58213.1 MAG: hypothetical protein A3I06_00870 [Candidatus Lindowbacteria bacterium RIFCSPLOWO2_02_FULL_62_12]
MTYPGISFLGRPGGGKKAVVAGSRIRVSQIAVEHERLGMTAEEIVNAHPHLRLFQVHEALAYYFRHKAALDCEIREDEKTVKRLARKFGVSYSL